MSTLRRLNLSKCTGLTSLPDLTGLTSLKEIVLDGCYGLKQQNATGMYALRVRVRGRLPPLLNWDYAE